MHILLDCHQIKSVSRLVRRGLRYCVYLVSAVVLASCAEIPSDAIQEASRQVASEFLLGPEDVVEVTVWRNQDLSRTITVRPDGMICTRHTVGLSPKSQNRRISNDGFGNSHSGAM